MKTMKAYQNDVNKKEGFFTLQDVFQTEDQCRAHGLKYIEKTTLLTLAETIFYPEGGGQPCDLGWIENIPLIDVFENKETETVYHRIACQALPEELYKKEKLHCVLDWERRFTHMQMHSAEHLLSGLIWDLFGGINKGFHMNQDYATIDILLPEGKDFSEGMLQELELKANQVIWENVNISTNYCSTKEEAESNPLRKPLALDEDISVVLIASNDHTYDCCACCGTHVEQTGQVGLIKIIRTENYKGMTRITLKAGLAAYKDVALRHKVSTALCTRFSTEIESLADRIAAQETKNGAIRKELYDLKKILLEEEKEGLLTSIAEQSDKKTSSIFVRTYNKYSADDLQTLARSLGENLPFLIALVSEGENTAILASSGNPSCGALVKDYASIYQGKGGGNPKLARAIFDKRDHLDVYLDLLEKHLR